MGEEGKAVHLPCWAEEEYRRQGVGGSGAMASGAEKLKHAEYGFLRESVLPDDERNEDKQGAELDKLQEVPVVFFCDDFYFGAGFVGSTVKRWTPSGRFGGLDATASVRSCSMASMAFCQNWC